MTNILALLRYNAPEEGAMAHRVITIARQVGTAGEEVARSVAVRLGFRYIDYYSANMLAKGCLANTTRACGFVRADKGAKLAGP